MTSTKRAHLEKHLEEKCCKYSEGFGFEHIKLDNAKRKWPDRMFLGPQGQAFIVEFKREGEVPRPQQENFHRKLNAMGHYVHVIDTLDDFKALFTRQ